MSNNLVISVYKPVSKTPLEVIKEFKQRYPQYANSVVSYAGRLDPMAHGVLILLIDEENKKRRDYENLKKTYQFKIIVGISTDTYDILGMIKKVDIPKRTIEDKINNLIPQFIGEIEQELPPYSSYRVKGKPLFKWARDNKLNEVVIPKRKVTIHSLEILNQEDIRSQDLLDTIKDRIEKLNGNFRQAEIIAKWKDSLKEGNHMEVIEMKAEVTSGTYIRGLVNSMSELLNVPMCCLEILRTKVGEFEITDISN